jgi:hypothetical protein
MDSTTLASQLAGRRKAIVREWLEQTLRTYPESTGRFLAREKDRFRNPVGYTLEQGLFDIFDGLAGIRHERDIASSLDGIVRMRAVQDFTASQAVAFVFLLKQIVRRHLEPDAAPPAAELEALDSKIDKLALLAFDLFMGCRQKIYELKAGEARRRVFVLERERQLVEEETIG